MSDNTHGPQTLKLLEAAITTEGVWLSFQVEESICHAAITIEQAWFNLPPALRVSIQEVVQEIEVHFSSLLREQFAS